MIKNGPSSSHLLDFSAPPPSWILLPGVEAMVLIMMLMEKFVGDTLHTSFSSGMLA